MCLSNGRLGAIRVLRGELHRIEVDLAVFDLDIWEWWTGGFARFLDWCGCW